MEKLFVSHYSQFLEYYRSNRGLWNENTYVDKVSVISFENGVSVIVDSAKSSYQDRFPMCGYESLHDDLYQIAICIQAAFDRIQSR